MNKYQARHKHLQTVSIILIVVLATQFLGGCVWADIARSVFAKKPTAEDTYLSIAEADKAIIEAMKAGETELTFNIANATEDDIKNIAMNMSPFWGVPKEYSIDRSFEDVKGIVEGNTVDVLKVSSRMQLSNNYYVVQNIRNGADIPNNKPQAKKISDALPGIIMEIFGENGEVGTTAYEQVVAAHDWICAQVSYDNSIDEMSTQNGSYGAIVDRRTMCVGYAESLQLILECATDVENQIIVGDSIDRTVGTSSDNWVGHAWNAVKMDGAWYHVDPTFDDPISNEPGLARHDYFGQNDAMMKSDHRWTEGYAPVCDAGNFFYFKKSGLIASDKSEFETLIRNIVKNGQPKLIEIATSNIEFTEKSLRFVFNENKNIAEVHWKENPFGDITILSIEPVYN